MFGCHTSKYPGRCDPLRSRTSTILMVPNRSMVRAEVHLQSKEEQILRWEETTQIKLLNMFTPSIQGAGLVSMLLRVLSLATMSWSRTMTLVLVERTNSNSGLTGSASVAKIPLLGITWYKVPPMAESFSLDHLEVKYTITPYGS